MKAVIMCGGTGSRLRPLTENKPKPMIKLLNRPMIEIILESVINAGIHDIYLSLGYMANDIIEFCETKKFNADIHYCEEAKPLGTAGGVKNCIKSSDDDILVLSGDNIFDFDINRIADFHYAADSDFTVVGTNVDDPREYGVIVKDDDGSIRSFVEKPLWEGAFSNLVNTGMYLMKGKILDLIPENTFYDFSENLFPQLFAENMRFMCCQADGFWGDMGEFDAYRKVTRDIFDGKIKNFLFNEKLYTEDFQDKNGSVIIAPCLIGKNTKTGKNSKIGPYCVIGNDCIIGNDCVLSGAIIGDFCEIGNDTDVHNALVAENVVLHENTFVEENAVIGFGAEVGRFSRILSGSKVWPGKKVSPESVVSHDMFFETPDEIEFDAFGLSGKIFSQFTVSDAAKIGQAIASIKGVQRIGVGSDGKNSSSIFKNLCACGIQSSGVNCYDFEEMYKSQAYFYSVYCSLDAFVFVSVNGDIVNFSFFGKNGLPLSSRTSRLINNNFRFSSFTFALERDCKDVYRMNLLSTVYKSALQKTLTANISGMSVSIECENNCLKELFEDFLQKNGCKDKKGLQFLVNEHGTNMYCIENDKFYSGSKIMSVICEIEAAAGNDIVIPEDAPAGIEKIARKYGRNVIRIYENSKPYTDSENISIASYLWAFDCVFLCVKLLQIMSETEMTLQQLCDLQEDFALRKSIIEFDCEPSEVRKKILASGATKNSEEDVFFVVETRKGIVRIRQMGNSNRIRMLVEAADMETAKEIAVDVSGKFSVTD